MEKIKALRCSASLADGVLTLEDGRQMDLAQIVQIIENITITAVNARQANRQSVYQEIDLCLAQAQAALKLLKPALDKTPSGAH